MLPGKVIGPKHKPVRYWIGIGQGDTPPKAYRALDTPYANAHIKDTTTETVAKYDQWTGKVVGIQCVVYQLRRSTDLGRNHVITYYATREEVDVAIRGDGTLSTGQYRFAYDITPVYVDLVL